MPRTGRVACLTALGLLFAVGLWFRVTSIETAPQIDGDEAWHAVQICNGFAGRPFVAFTPYANPINPFYSLLHVPLVKAHTPVLWLLRVPAVACGILAVVLTYTLGAKVLDRTTAMIASALLAVLPIAILFSRISYDVSPTPLYTLVAIYFAFRRNRVAAMVAFVVCFIVHPTNIFVLPVLLSILLVQEIKAAAGDRARQWRAALATLAVPVLLAAGAGVMILRRPQMQEMQQPGLKPTLGGHDLHHFLTVWRRLFLALPQATSEATTLWNDLLFWIPFAALTLAGTWRMARRGQWDRVALVAGMVASLGGFFVVAGSNAICPAWVSWLRYGLFLVIPAVLSVACAASALLVEPTTRARSLVRHLQHAGLLLVGVASLCCIKVNWFDLFAARGGESVWTLKTESKDKFRLSYSRLRRELERGTPVAYPKVVIAENHWIQRPIQYLALKRDDVEVVAYDVWEGIDRGMHQDLLEVHMRRGACVLSVPGSPLEADVASRFPPEDLVRWDIPSADRRELTVYRLRPTATAAKPTADGATSRR